jgi:hypothetical protein
MRDSAAHRHGRFARRPRRLAAGTVPGRSRWWWETAALILIGLVLAVVVINAAGFVSGIGGRVPADTATWRRYAHNRYAAVSVTTLQIPQTRDVACGNIRPGPTGTVPRLCLLIVGAKQGRVRSVIGGWKLPAGVQDVPAYRHGCFGASVEQGLCPLEEHP